MRALMSRNSRLASVLVMPQNDSEQVENAASTFFMRPLWTSCDRNGVVGR